MTRGKKEGRERDEKEEIGKVEVEEVINRLKGGKAAEVDGSMANEVWKYGEGRVKEWI